MSHDPDDILSLRGDDGSSLAHRLLVAMPGVAGDVFSGTVVYLCAHGSAGAMGLVVNRRIGDVRFSDLFAQLNLPRAAPGSAEPPVYFGGPVELGRGFILHSTDVLRQDSVRLNDRIAVTGTVDILRAIVDGEGPRRSLFALGYAGWAAGQLESEIRDNQWLVVPADDDVLFDPDPTRKWEKALAGVGVDADRLSGLSGRA